MKIKHVLWLLVAACGSDVERPSPNPPPSWGAPITGGTMLVTRDGKFAVIADADRDRIVAVDLASQDTTELALEKGDEPGRLVEDGAGRIHVALRGGGALLSLASPTATDATRRVACAEPRGLAWQASTDQVHVACSSGELVTFAQTGDAVRTLRLERDLRDVIVDGDRLRITRFRTAELLTVDATTGAIVERATAPTVKRTVVDGGSDCPTCGGISQPQIVDAPPAVAWRALPMPDGAVLVSHQRQIKGRMQTTPGGYGMGCGGGPVEAAVTVVRPGQPPFAVSPLVNGTLPVDVALSPRGDLLAFAFAGTQTIHRVQVSNLVAPDKEEEECGGHKDVGAPIRDDLGAPTSIAFTPDGKLVVFYPESPAIVIHASAVDKQVVALPGGLGYDAGRELFHTQTNSGLACASCHPEGRDDGLVWEFEGIGFRRTQSLAGNILSRAPYHWNGDMEDLEMLMHDVFGERMGGGVITRSMTLSLGPWLERIPAPKGIVTDATAVERGRAVFESVDVGCASCHNGAALTNNQLVNVGTGGVLKVPSLVGVGARAPFMHDGCAKTLLDRFTLRDAVGACGGGDTHGKTSHLAEAQLADLVAYLESL